MTAQTRQLERLQDLTAQFGRASRPTFGLSAVLGGVILLGWFALEMFVPVPQPVRGLRFLVALGVWLASVSATRRTYLKWGEVRAAPTPRERRQVRFALAFALLVGVLGVPIVLWLTHLNGAPLAAAFPYALRAPLVLLAFAFLAWWSFCVTREQACAMFLIGGLNTVLFGAPPELETFAQWAVPAGTLIVALGLVGQGVAQHLAFLRAKHELADLHSASS